MLVRDYIQQTLTRLPNVVKVVATLTAILFLSALFPNTAKFKYEFREGLPWIYDNLVAPFDFAIKKTPAQLEQERNKVSKEFTPYFHRKDSVATQQSQRFARHWAAYVEHHATLQPNTPLVQQQERYWVLSQDILQQFWRRGVIKLPPAFTNAPQSILTVLTPDGVAHQHLVAQFVPTGDALSQQLMDSLTKRNVTDAPLLHPYLLSYLHPNILYDDTLTNIKKAQQLAAISLYEGLVSKGEVIVARGDIVNALTLQKLDSYKEQMESELSTVKTNKWVYVGYVLLISLLLTMYAIYIYYKQTAIWEHTSHYLLLLSLLVVMCYLTYAVETSKFISIYLVPFCIVPIIVKQLFDVRLALFSHLIIVLTASLITQSNFDFIFLQIAAGMVASLVLYSMRYWSGFMWTILYIFGTYTVAYIGLSLIKNTGLSSIDWSFMSWIFINVTLTLLASPILPLLERIIGKISSVMLMELSDINAPLLKELSMRAPGTFQHSLQVAHLAEAAASGIGANARLVRVGALYHDIGKSKHPKYFVENQVRQDNPHELLTYTESAEKIKAHVSEGVRLAKKRGIPTLLIDFIRTHHGTTRIEYFYRSYQNIHPNEEVPEDFFRYPGPLPTTKEQCILMFADSLEAISRSLKSPNEPEIDNLVEATIAMKIRDGQMQQSHLTFTELEQIKQIFKTTIKSMHHLRIEYPKPVS